MKFTRILLLFIVLAYSCNYSNDTLGGWPERTFPVSKENLTIAINKLYQDNPNYKVPDKWKYADSSEIKSYFFLPSVTFYFKNNPEEMYYVTFIGDDAMLADKSKISIDIRSVSSDGNYDGENNWVRYDNQTLLEKQRIEKRFDEEIISKLEQYTHSHVIKATNRFAVTAGFLSENPAETKKLRTSM